MRARRLLGARVNQVLLSVSRVYNVQKGGKLGLLLKIHNALTLKFALTFYTNTLKFIHNCPTNTKPYSLNNLPNGPKTLHTSLR